MKRLLLILIAILPALPLKAYNDHRVKGLDSLEREAGRWTPEAIDKASDEDLAQLTRTYISLMRGYNQLNGEKSMFYARRALSIAIPRNWYFSIQDAYRYLGQHHWAREQYDSAIFYYKSALRCADKMAAGATHALQPEGYDEKAIDDAYSSLYGSIGNVYNMMDSIPQAMTWYAKAGEIFEKHGWKESNSVLWYNIGETWVEEGDLGKALEAYKKCLDYADAAKDSLLVANAQKGLGRLYMEKGRPGKALHYLSKANEYYAAHEKEEMTWSKETYEYTSMALAQQRRQLAWLSGILLLLAVTLIAVFFLAGKLRRSRAQIAEADALMEETLQDLRPSVEVSAREAEILDLLSKGYTTPQVADCLHLSPETIKWYRKKLLVKFDVANTTELVLKAKEAGLIN